MIYNFRRNPSIRWDVHSSVFNYSTSRTSLTRSNNECGKNVSNEIFIMNDEKIPPNFQQTVERNVKIDLDLATRMKSYSGIELLSGAHGHFGLQLSAPYAEPLWSASVVVGQFWKHIVVRLFRYVFTTVAAGNWLI